MRQTVTHELSELNGSTGLPRGPTPRAGPPGPSPLLTPCTGEREAEARETACICRRHFQVSPALRAVGEAARTLSEVKMSHHTASCPRLQENGGHVPRLG